MPLQIEMSQTMIQEVMDEWQRENPGDDIKSMSSKEFADRMMVKVKASAKLVPDPAAH